MRHRRGSGGPLPVVSALELLTCLATKEIDLPTILMTAGHDPVVHAGATAAGCVTLIDKPFDRTSLLQAIGRTSARLQRGLSAGAEAPHGSGWSRTQSANRDSKISEYGILASIR